MTHFVTHQELQEAFGVKQKGKLELTLRRNKINYFYSDRGTLCTTPEELNRALSGGVTGNIDDEPIDFVKPK